MIFQKFSYEEELTNVIKDQGLLECNWYDKGIRIPAAIRNERGEYQNFLHISDKLKNAWSCRILYPQFYILVIRTCPGEHRGDNNDRMSDHLSTIKVSSL